MYDDELRWTYLGYAVRPQRPLVARRPLTIVRYVKRTVFFLKGVRDAPFPGRSRSYKEL